MHPDATDSSGAGLSPAPAADARGHPASGAPGAPCVRRPELREDAAPPGTPTGGSWRVAVALAALAAVSLSCLGPGCWQAARGAGPCTVLLRLSLYLGCAAAAFLLGILFALVFRSRQAPPPDFAAARARMAAAARRLPGVSTGLPAASSAAASARPSALPVPPPALGDPVGGGVARGPRLPERHEAVASRPGG